MAKNFITYKNKKFPVNSKISGQLHQSLFSNLEKNTKKLNDVRSDPRINYYGGHKKKQEHVNYLKGIVAENKKLIKANTNANHHQR